jgi:hypothetical protein
MDIYDSTNLPEWALWSSGNAGPSALFQGDTIPWAYAMLHFFLNPLTDSRAFIGRVESASTAAQHLFYNRNYIKHQSPTYKIGTEHLLHFMANHFSHVCSGGELQMFP